MLKIEVTQDKVVVSGTSVYRQPHTLDSLIDELKKAQQKLIEEQEKTALDSDHFYEMWAG